ncbi:MAG: ABC transporter permease [Miniphocaeibacter sp.]|uniref:ABC transporter permease n=1 Tax=Miniphocaeibacter sp. TaxID=3100973 RepID=UPI001841D6A1|nr:ABC transporter permease [Gallicola sp.]
MLEFLKLNYMDILNKTLEHLYISSMALVLGIIVAVPLGIILTRTKKISNIIIGLASLLQTIPSLALLAIMIPIFGVGKFPAIIALFIYSLLPILRNTYLGVVGVDENIVDAAKGMGMTKTQSILKVEVPLAAPVIMAGVRLSAVYVVAWATLASYIGAGGLGDLIFSGLNNYNPNLIIFGTIPVTALALIVDFLLSKVEKLVTAKTGMEEI